MAVQFEAVCGPKLVIFWADVEDPLSTHLSDYGYHVLVLRYWPLKLPLSCEVVDKRWFWGPDLYGDGAPQISDMHFQIALTSEHVAGFG